MDYQARCDDLSTVAAAGPRRGGGTRTAEQHHPPFGSHQKALCRPDPRGIRKALNFGHTTGHAIESLALEAGEPLLHGYAVAWGMIAELHLSVNHCGFPRDEAVRMTRWIRHLYGEFPPYQAGSKPSMT